MARPASEEIDEQLITDEAIYDRFIAVEEYLRIEERSPLRHEYVAGMLYAMTGGSLRHSELVGNVYTAVRPAAGRERCRV